MQYQIITGCRHQIRFHSQQLGWPLVSDPRYGSRKESYSWCPRLFLHSYVTSVPKITYGSQTQERIVITSPLPKDLCLVLDNLQLVDAHTSPGAYWPHRIWTREQTKLSPGLFEPGEGSALFKVERLQKPYVFNDGKESLGALWESPGVRGPSSEPPLKQRRLAECTRDWVRLESRSNPGCYFYHNAKEGKTLKEPPERSG